MNIYLSANPKNDQHKIFIRKYVIKELSKRLKIKEKDITLFDVFDEDFSNIPDNIKIKSFYILSKTLLKMSVCDYFVVFKTYMFEMCTDRCITEQEMWKYYGSNVVNEPITIWELD